MSGHSNRNIESNLNASRYSFHIQRISCQPGKTTLHGGQSRSWSAVQVLFIFLLLWREFAFLRIFLYPYRFPLPDRYSFHIQRISCQPGKTTLHGGQSRSWSAVPYKFCLFFCFYGESSLFFEYFCTPTVFPFQMMFLPNSLSSSLLQSFSGILFLLKKNLNAAAILSLPMVGMVDPSPYFCMVRWHDYRIIPFFNLFLNLPISQKI